MFYLNQRFEVVITLRRKLVSFPNVKNIVLSTSNKLKINKTNKMKISTCYHENLNRSWWKWKFRLLIMKISTLHNENFDCWSWKSQPFIMKIFHDEIHDCSAWKISTVIDDTIWDSSRLITFHFTSARVAFRFTWISWILPFNVCGGCSNINDNFILGQLIVACYTGKN